MTCQFSHFKIGQRVMWKTSPGTSCVHCNTAYPDLLVPTIYKGHLTIVTTDDGCRYPGDVFDPIQEEIGSLCRCPGCGERLVHVVVPCHSKLEDNFFAAAIAQQVEIDQ